MDDNESESVPLCTAMLLSILFSSLPPIEKKDGDKRERTVQKMALCDWSMLMDDKWV